MSDKNPNAVALGHLGGLKSGPARMAKLSREERVRIAKIAAQKRWDGHTKKNKWEPILLYCPFCKGNNLFVDKIDEIEFITTCQNCGGVGPVGNTKQDAIDKWNGE